MEIVCPLRVTSAVPAGLGRLCCAATQPASASASRYKKSSCLPHPVSSAVITPRFVAVMPGPRLSCLPGPGDHLWTVLCPVSMFRSGWVLSYTVDLPVRQSARRTRPAASPRRRLNTAQFGAGDRWGSATLRHIFSAGPTGRARSRWQRSFFGRAQKLSRSIRFINGWP